MRGPDRRRLSLAGCLLVAAGLALGACGDDDTAEDPTTTSASDPATTTTTTVAPDGPDDPDGSPPDAVEDLSAANVVLTPVAELAAPMALVPRPGSTDLLVAERRGTVRLVTADGAVDETPILDITAETTTDGERGLLGLALHPDGDRLYLSFTDSGGDTRLDEWRFDGAAVDQASRRTLLTQDQPFANHNGGHIGFGPDGMLYLGLGDGGGGGDPLGAGQDFSTWLGSILRIDPEPDRDRAYTIPGDNPFVDGGGEPEIWITGVRNPWRFSWDRLTGDLWVADVGQNAVEEVTVLFADGDEAAGGGANLGWAIFEGDRPFAGGPEPANYVPPLHTYGHRPGCSITGGHVSRGDALPGLRGVYLYSDFCDNRIHAVLQRDAQVVESRALDVSVPSGGVVSFGEGAEGELYVLTLGGGLFRIDPA